MTPRQRAFLSAYAKTGNVRQAARFAQVGRRDHYDWLQDPAYATAFDDAKAEACEWLEQEARRRAVLGVDKPLVHQGRITYEPKRDENGELIKTAGGELIPVPQTIKEYSDALLMFLMKGAMPQKYRDNVKVEHSGSLTMVTERLAAARKRMQSNTSE